MSSRARNAEKRRLDDAQIDREHEQRDAETARLRNLPASYRAQERLEELIGAEPSQRVRDLVDAMIEEALELRL